ncbi:MAG: glycogen synthase GlgA [SAR324 cluster bacterium]
MRVLYVTPELAPWIKAGGLGDVAQGLPSALARAGVDVRVLAPAYRELAQAFPDANLLANFPEWGGKFAPAQLLIADTAVPLYLLGCPAYFARGGTAYQSPAGVDWQDNHLRFGLLGRTAAALASDESPLDWKPDILHCNDWQCGLGPAYLAHLGGAKAETVSTVHNLAYQGIFPAAALGELALPPGAFAIDGLEYHGRVSFLKSALFYSTKLTTVSPTYAKEIQSPQLGFGLDGLLRRRAADLVGILNGIDADVWNPARDPHLARTYDAESLDLKALDKAALQREFGLPEDARIPLLGMVSRLVEQKGIDLVVPLAARLAERGIQLVALGSGQRDLETALGGLAERFPRAIAVRIGFSEPLAHRIEAGADLFLMPSRFEPSGLNQLFSMRYGTPPIVHRTGGLADSVVDADRAALEAGRATGFSFDAPSSEALLGAIDRALEIYRTPERWRSLQRSAMARDFSWAASARKYIEVYESALPATTRA